MIKKAAVIVSLLTVMLLCGCNSNETKKLPVSESSVIVSSESEGNTSSDNNQQTISDVSELQPSESEVNISSSSIDNESAQASVEESSQEREETKAAREKVEQIINSELKTKAHTVDVEFISQNPELPTGCESVALAMALNALGYKTEKTEIADNYMPIGESYVTSFLGDPHRGDGAGIYPPGLVISAENYIKAKNLNAGAVDLTDTDFKNLYKLIENGYPIVFWYTINLNEPYHYDKDDYNEVYNSKNYPWITNIHCAVMNGYDLEAGTVTFTDPISGTLVYDSERVEYIYERVGKMAMTVISGT